MTVDHLLFNKKHWLPYDTSYQQAEILPKKITIPVGTSLSNSTTDQVATVTCIGSTPSKYIFIGSVHFNGDGGIYSTDYTLDDPGMIDRSKAQTVSGE